MLKKFLIALAFTQIFNFSPNVNDNFDYETKVFAKSNAEQKFDEGNEFLKNQDYNSALEKFNEAIKINPNYYSAYYERGKIYYELKKYDKALADFQKVLKIDPHFARTYGKIGEVYYNLKDYPNALENLNQAIRIENEEDAQKYREIVNKINIELAEQKKTEGNELFDKNDYERAIPKYSEAIKFNPNFANAWYNRGLVYYELKKYD